MSASPPGSRGWVRADPMSLPLFPRRLQLTLATKRRASDRTLIVTLRLGAGHAFAYRPGQFVGLEAVDGRPRYFSIANAQPVDDEIELHINRVPGGAFTGALFDTARVGDSFWMTGPFGDFALAPAAASSLILVAGGTGFAPIKACLQQLASLSQEDRGPRRAIHLYWGARTSADLYDIDGIAHLAERLPGLRFVPVVDQGTVDGSTRPGPVHQAVVADFANLSDHDIYACGAPGMIDALSKTCAAERGFDPARLVADVFIAGATDTDASRPAGSPVDVALDTRDGRQAVAGTAGEALLFALKRAGVPMQSVCGGKGACGTCRVRIAPEWRDRLPPPAKRETRLLQFIGAEEGDRLSCQILLAANLGGLELQTSLDNLGESQ